MHLGHYVFVSFKVFAAFARAAETVSLWRVPFGRHHGRGVMAKSRWNYELFLIPLVGDAVNIISALVWRLLRNCN